MCIKWFVALIVSQGWIVLIVSEPSRSVVIQSSSHRALDELLYDTTVNALTYKVDNSFIDFHVAAFLWLWRNGGVVAKMQ